MDAPHAHLDLTRMPKHVALIMDGNGRWAKQRGLPRTAGHSAGEESIVECVDGALEVGLRWLTVYAFSTENWKRPVDEVRFLMNYNRDLLFRRRDEFRSKGVRIRFIGRRDDRRLPRKLVAIAEEAEEMTRGCRKLNLTIALNYGGRAEIMDGFRHLAQRVEKGEVDAEKVSERDLRGFFYAPEMPDPDVIVRTSGEMRTSNFLLWQGAYSELVFTPVLWPDFRREHLWEAIGEFQRRARRFGGVR
ncbi:MAG TPA: polyprenyl diphosphate synthase [Actinomycetota bacterium]|nr:polyprenyl diphosphate synthase [Actinomycetota bacterium]